MDFHSYCDNCWVTMFVHQKKNNGAGCQERISMKIKSKLNKKIN